MLKTIFNLSTSLLKDVIYNDLPFAIAIKQKFKNEKISSDDKKIISVLTGCELRHHLVFTEIIKKEFESIDDETLIQIALAHANNLFVKEFDFEEVIDYIHQISVNKQLNKTREEIKEYFDKYSNTQTLIPETVDVNSLEFLSLRFNTPLWLVKMWNKTYGRKLTFKILKANSKAPLKTCRVNTSIIEASEVLAKENLYQKAFIDDMVIYQGNLPFNKQKYLETYHLFQQKMGFKYLVDKLDIDPFKGVAIYQGMSSNFYLEVGLKGHFSIPTDLIFATYQDFYQVKSNIANFKINNVKVYQSSSDSIVTCVSKKVDTFFVLPKSSNFELLRTTPDYFLRFDPKTLDSILSEQYKSLCECSSFVEDEGKLVYLIPTISNKEGRGIVNKFLQEHSDFYLEEERQLFPFDPYDSSLYFAILRKRIIENND